MTLARATVLLCLAFAASALPGHAAGVLQRWGMDLVLEGRPFRAVGVNKFDLALQFIRGGEEREQARRALADIAGAGFTVVRFGAVGFYPRDLELWPSPEYWRRWDDLVATARGHGLRLVPVLVWNTYLFPDLAGESVQDMMTNRDSRSRQYLELYVHQVVSRYRDEPTILFWELWSELNLGADLAFMRPYGFSDLNAVSLGAAPMRLAAG